MSHDARWTCWPCGRLLGTVQQGRLRLDQAVRVAYADPAGGIGVVCPGCDAPRRWIFEGVGAMTAASGT